MNGGLAYCVSAAVWTGILVHKITDIFRLESVHTRIRFRLLYALNALKPCTRTHFLTVISATYYVWNFATQWYQDSNISNYNGTFRLLCRVGAIFQICSCAWVHCCIYFNLATLWNSIRWCLNSLAWGKNWQWKVQAWIVYALMSWRVAWTVDNLKHDLEAHHHRCEQKQ